MYNCKRNSGKITQLAVVPKASYILSQFHYSPVTHIGPDGIEKKQFETSENILFFGYNVHNLYICIIFTGA